MSIQYTRIQTNTKHIKTKYKILNNTKYNTKYCIIPNNTKIPDIPKGIQTTILELYKHNTENTSIINK